MNNLNGDRDLAYKTMLQLGRFYNNDESTILSYALADKEDDLKCFVTDTMIRVILDGFIYDYFYIYSHRLQYAWIEVETSDHDFLYKVFLQEARNAKCLAGLDMTIGDKSFVV